MTKSVIVWIFIASFCYIHPSVCTGTTYTSKACYGAGGLVCTRHDISCNSTQKIAIFDAYYTNNPDCTLTGISDCDTVNPANVTEHGYHRFSNTKLVPLYINCSRKRKCLYPAPRRSAALAFSVVKYQCIKEYASLNCPEDDSLSISAEGLSKVVLAYGDTVMSNCTVQSITYVCSFKSDVSASSISIYALDVRLRRRRRPGLCLSQLSVLHGTHITTTNCSTVFEPFERLNVTTELPIYLDLSQQSLIWLLINTSDPFSMGCETEDLTTTITSTGSTVNTVFSTQDITSPGQTRNNTGAIAGGIVATVVTVLVTFVSVWITRQRRAKSESKKTSPIDAKPDMTYSLAGKIPQENYYEIQDLKTQNSDYDYATAEGVGIPPTTNTYSTIEPAGKQTAKDNSIAHTAEGEYDHIGDHRSPQTSDYDTTASVAQPGNTGEDGYGYNHFQKKVNPQTHQNDYDTAASATQERNTDEDDYDHFHRGTNASETVSSPYDTTSGIEDNSDYSVAGQMK